MKTKHWYMVCLFFVILLFVSVAKEAKSEIKDFGEFCFSLDDGITYGAPIFKNLRLYVTSLNDNSFSLNGKYIVSPGGLFPVHGTAIRDGDNIVATLTGTSFSEEALLPVGDIFYLHIVVNASSLTGYYTVMFTQIASSESSPGEFITKHGVHRSFPIINSSCN